METSSRVAVVLWCSIRSLWHDARFLWIESAVRISRPGADDVSGIQSREYPAPTPWLAEIVFRRKTIARSVSEKHTVTRVLLRLLSLSTVQNPRRQNAACSGSQRGMGAEIHGYVEPFATKPSQKPLQLKALAK
jgi:hypothetical protein